MVFMVDRSKNLSNKTWILMNKLKNLICILPLIFSLQVGADEWAAEIVKGMPFPQISASDQTGKAWTSETLSGKNGYLLLFNRSVVW